MKEFRFTVDSPLHPPYVEIFQCAVYRRDSAKEGFRYVSVYSFETTSPPSVGDRIHVPHSGMEEGGCIVEVVSRIFGRPSPGSRAAVDHTVHQNPLPVMVDLVAQVAESPFSDEAVD